jgi:hypothetical protein
MAGCFGIVHAAALGAAQHVGGLEQLFDDRPGTGLGTRILAERRIPHPESDEEEGNRENRCQQQLVLHRRPWHSPGGLRVCFRLPRRSFGSFITEDKRSGRNSITVFYNLQVVFYFFVYSFATY